MEWRPFVRLAHFTTLRVGGPVRWMVVVDDPERQLPFIVRWAYTRGIPWVVMGEGSNMLVPDEGYRGIVVRLASKGVRWERLHHTSHALVIADAGVSLDALVRTTTEEGWWGLERLAGIPGTVGAAVVQNAGAYGREVGDIVEWVEVMSPHEGTVMRLPASHLAFQYRSSALKAGGRLAGWVVIRAAFRLAATPQPPHRPFVFVEELIANNVSPEVVAAQVRERRATRLPPLPWGTAGSFFQNPTVPALVLRRLLVQEPELPYTRLPGGKARIALAWILDHKLHLRGRQWGRVEAWRWQPLVLATREGASAREVRMAARDIAALVRRRFPFLTLEPEVETLTEKGCLRIL